MPQLFSKFEGISNENKEISELIHQGLNDLNSLQNTKIPYELISEKFQTKEYNTLRKMKLLYKSIKQISGVRVLISIKGDSFLENFLVSIITRNCEVCINVPIKLDILAVDTLNQSVEITAAVEQKIIPHMYLIYNDRKLSLQFDENFPNEKNSVIINLKNFGWTSVLVWQAEESVILTVTDPKIEKKINKVQLLSFDHSLASVPLSFLAKKLTSCLRYKEKNGEVDVEWVEDPQTRFTKKENDSKLMNEEYIKESLGTQAFYRVWADEVFINNSRYLVQCLAYHSLMKIIVTFANKSLEITPETEAYKFIFCLQSVDIAKNSTTLCKSLELRKLIKSFFL